MGGKSVELKDYFYKKPFYMVEPVYDDAGKIKEITKVLVRWDGYQFVKTSVGFERKEENKDYGKV